MPGDRILGCIWNGMNDNMENNILPLYKSMVHLQLEHNAQCWSPLFKKEFAEFGGGSQKDDKYD